MNMTWTDAAKTYLTERGFAEADSFNPINEEISDDTGWIRGWVGEQLVTLYISLGEIVEHEVENERDEPEDSMTDVEADADTLASAGMGTDEDYGCYGGGCDE
jgi:hypothetical protein